MTPDASTSTSTPRRSALHRPLAMRVARAEYARVAAAIGRLGPEDWARPTRCADWDVRQLACHIVGMATMASTPWESSRQLKAARAETPPGGAMVDALTDLQVRERAALTPDEIVAAARRIGPRAALGRRLTPFFLRRTTLPDAQLVDGREELWTLGYLIDVILTRDPWMHRIDLSDAVGQPLELSADHDGVIVDDVVREWASRHGRPYRLELTGPAGGRWESAAPSGNPESLSMDAIEFCRVLSGRAPGVGLLSTQVPF